MLITSIPLKAFGTPESLLLQADHNIDIVFSPRQSCSVLRERKRYHVETCPRLPPAVPAVPLFYSKSKGRPWRKSIRWYEGAPASSSASRATFSSQIYVRLRGFAIFWLTHNHSRLTSSEVIAYNELTTRLHLHHKPVRNAKPHGG